MKYNKINNNNNNDLEFIIHNFQNIDNINYILNYIFIVIKENNIK